MEYITEYTTLHLKERRQLSYKRKYKQDVPSWDDSMVLLTRLVGVHTRPPIDVLDVGCGHGNFVIDELGAVFGKKIGYDVSAEAISGNTSVEQTALGDGRDLPFEAASFDLIISLWTFEHIKDPTRTLREAFHVLRSGGICAFVTPNKNSFLIILRRLMNKRIANRLLDALYGRRDDDVFDVFYRANSIRDLRRLAQETGFSIECLLENADPSYTSFGNISYTLSKWFSLLPWSLSKPHLIVVLQKPG